MFGLEIKNLSLFLLQNEEKYFSNIQDDSTVVLDPKTQTLTLLFKF